MFQFAGFASHAYEFSMGYRLRGGFPHSEILGSKPARGSPKLIATCYVLHRLSVPRHPPDALQTLDLNSNENACATRRNKPARELADRASCFRRSMLLPAKLVARPRSVLGHLHFIFTCP